MQRGVRQAYKHRMHRSQIDYTYAMTHIVNNDLRHYIGPVYWCLPKVVWQIISQFLFHMYWDDMGPHDYATLDYKFPIPEKRTPIIKEVD